MRSLEKGEDKIQKICDKLRHKTLEPAEKEALQIIEEARKKADAIKAEAERHAEQMIKQARGRDASYYPRSSVRALKGVGLLDPTQPFPEDSLWVADPAAAALVAGALEGAEVGWSSHTALGSVVFTFPAPPDLRRRLAGPDLALITAAREAGLFPIYELKRWDGEAAGLLRRAAAVSQFPRAALVRPQGDAALRFASAPESRYMDDGMFFAAAHPGDFAALPRRSALAAPAAQAASGSAAAVSAAFQEGWPRLLVLPLEPSGDPDLAVDTVRDALHTLRGLGVETSLPGPAMLARGPRWPPPALRAWRRGLGFALAACLPFLCLALSLETLRRGLASQRGALAAPLWQIVAAYLAATAAALAAGAVLHGLLFPDQPGHFFLLARALPFAIAAAVLFRPLRRGLGKRLSRPLRLGDGLVLLAAPAVLWLLWGMRPGPGVFGLPFLPWRAVLLGAPCLFARCWVRARKTAGLHGLIEDDRPLLLFALWLPLEPVLFFYVSSAPFWAVAYAALVTLAAGGAVGALALALLAYYDVYRRSWRIHSRWI